MDGSRATPAAVALFRFTAVCLLADGLRRRNQAGQRQPTKGPLRLVVAGVLPAIGCPAGAAARSRPFVCRRCAAGRGVVRDGDGCRANVDFILDMAVASCRCDRHVPKRREAGCEVDGRLSARRISVSPSAVSTLVPAGRRITSLVARALVARRLPADTCDLVTHRIVMSDRGRLSCCLLWPRANGAVAPTD
jgi:hypothetical protein